MQEKTINKILIILCIIWTFTSISITLTLINILEINKLKTSLVIFLLYIAPSILIGTLLKEEISWTKKNELKE